MEKRRGDRVAKLPTIRRLPRYLTVLRRLMSLGREVVSSSYLADELRVERIVAKKDLEITGITGRTGVGYVVADLIDAIEDFLGWNNTTEAFLVGVGNLGSALLGYEGFKSYGLDMIAAFDTDPSRIGRMVQGINVFSLDKLPDLAERMHIQMAVLTVPAESAQQVADLLVNSGIRGIWNFTTINLRVPEGVLVQREDLAAGLAELSVKMRRDHE
ncbi:MAG: redox-sensing transcriptional repressor Rex [Candidatus Wallbacteria bacterium HGW-Wallbacteria-1]|uniref:Redox-sensing transcriptional repressor Rex n=1 Tax=Candidatus Wallbacteria bacterium HGW-Wallbacteria-1 TaxID=2013854 RepID=A0A2N1PNC0_9BACT|nr:MAG: redox-sensing transcriptional repressor Rex [Candidatus Wallbacteria bacterium HGW-Wallbacteria-1]